jgi:transmembrane sensor
MTEHDKLREASEWWVRLQEDSALEQGREWVAWSQNSPANLDAFDRVESLAAELRSLSAKDRTDLVGEFLGSSSSRASSRTRKAFSRWGLSLAAAIMLATAGLIYLIAPSDETTYTTDRALHQEITLSDGSTLAVGASSIVSVQMRSDERRIRLRDGEAYFKVEKDSARPFVVDAGEIVVTAVGTSFDVRRTGRSVAVSVTEGRVRVAQRRGEGMLLSAGERVSYEPDTQHFSVSAVTPARATAWRERRLEFVNEPLEVVIANVNRYASRRIEIADPAVARLAFTGTVLPEELASWLEALPSVLPVRVDHHSNEVRLESASKP